jgi:hypothetical protein
METLLKGNITRREQLAKATRVAASQLEEGDELYIAIRTNRSQQGDHRPANGRKSL